MKKKHKMNGLGIDRMMACEAIVLVMKVYASGYEEQRLNKNGVRPHLHDFTHRRQNTRLIMKHLSVTLIGDSILKHARWA